MSAFKYTFCMSRSTSNCILKTNCSRLPVLIRTRLVASIPSDSAGCIKLPIRPKILFVANIFLVIFLLTCEILFTSLHFFGVFVVCGALGLVLWLKSKKHRGSVSLPSSVGNYPKSYRSLS